MLTQEENDLLCRVEGNAPMGRIMRRHLAAGLHVGGGGGAATARRCAFGSSARTLSCSATAEGRLGALDEHCPHRRASLAFGRNEECGLRCLYHGWKFDVDGNILEMASEPEGAGSKPPQAQILSGARGRRLRLGLHGCAGDACANSSRRAWAPTARTRTSIVKMHAACNWAQVLEGSIDSAHMLDPSFLRTCRPWRSTAPRRPRRVAAPLDRQVAAHPGAGDAMGLPLRRDPQADPQSRDARLYPHDAVHRALHRADPAQRSIQAGADAGADRRCEHDVLLGRVARDRRASTRMRGASSAARRSASISTRTTASSATSRTASCRTAPR